MIEHLRELFKRDLSKVNEELIAYDIEENLWVVKAGIKNSAGNLFMHINGNLMHFIGAILGGTGYERDRDFEFNGRKQKVIISDEIKETIEVVEKVLFQLNDADLTNIYPIEVFGKPITTGQFLFHLYGHLNWHLGQINYHRRLLDA